jgi:hypothetical protein
MTIRSCDSYTFVKGHDLSFRVCQGRSLPTMTLPGTEYFHALPEPKPTPCAIATMAEATSSERLRHHQQEVDRINCFKQGCLLQPGEAHPFLVPLGPDRKPLLQFPDVPPPNERDNWKVIGQKMVHGKSMNSLLNFGMNYLTMLITATTFESHLMDDPSDSCLSGDHTSPKHSQ